MTRGFQFDCYKCGKVIPDNQGVQRSMKMEKSSGGQYHYRNVNLCPQCDVNQNNSEKNEKVKKALLIVLAMVLLVGGTTYLLFIR